MIYDLTGKTASGTYGRLVQVIHGTSSDSYYDGFGNPLDIGTIGPTGSTGPSGTSVMWQGEWDNMMMYFPLDMVSYGGNSYISTGSPTAGPPFQSPDIDTTNWDLMTQKGATGATGPYAPFYFQTSKPSPDPTILGSRWIDSDNGREFVWVYDGVNYVWMQPTQLVSMKNTTGVITTATYSANFLYEYYGVTYMGGICEVTLPVGTAPDDEGKFISIADEVGGISKYNRGILVKGSAGQLINGVADVLMKLERMSLTFMFRNSSWKTI